MTTNVTGARALRIWQAEHDLHSNDVAAKLEIGAGYYSNLRRGKRVPSRALASKIATLTAGAVPMSAWDAPSSPGAIDAPINATPAADRAA